MRTDFLFVWPSIWAGLASQFGALGLPERFNVSQTPREADLRALWCDFTMASCDVSFGVRAIGEEHPELANSNKP